MKKTKDFKNLSLGSRYHAELGPHKPVIDLSICKDCGVDLTPENWYLTNIKANHKVCKACIGVKRASRSDRGSAFIYNAF